MLFAAARLKPLVLLAVAALAANAVQADPNAPKKGGVAYRWVDEQGVVHYGDNVPPQYASQQRAVLNGDGIEVGRVDAQKTPDQLQAEARERNAVMKQKQHDAFLITTYTSVKDIEALRDARLEQLHGVRAAAEQYVDSLRGRLTSLQSNALDFAPYSSRPDARRMPDLLAENLVRTVNELNVQSAALAEKGKEEAAVRAQFQADIERYRELHTIHSQ
jgi:hypothetical protein